MVGNQLFPEVPLTILYIGDFLRRKHEPIGV